MERIINEHLMIRHLCVKRGYIPDGSGVWADGKIAEPYTTVENGDGLVLYMSKN